MNHRRESQQIHVENPETTDIFIVDTLCFLEFILEFSILGCCDRSVYLSAALCIVAKTVRDRPIVCKGVE